MLRVSAGFSLMASAALAACAPGPRPEPVPLPPQQPVQRPVRPPPLPPPAPAHWADLALSPGGWSYRSEGAGSVASYGSGGQASFAIRCGAGRQVTLERTGAGTGSVLTVRTTSGARTLPGRAAAGALAATLPASDRLLDDIVFSRGRFMIEVQSVQALVLPAWAEPARVVEDCRG